MKKAFTLIELVAVIILIGVIGLITTPIITNTINKNKESLYQSQLAEIKEAASKWAYNNLDLLPSIDGQSISVTLLDLKKAGFLTIDLRDPRDGQLLPNDMVVNITYKNNQYVYDVDEESGTNINNEYNANAPTIVLNGSNIIYVEINSEYNELGASAKNSSGNTTTVNIQYKENDTEIASITTNQYKTFTVVYSATDTVGGTNYTSYIIRTVVIRDTTAPNLTIPYDIEITSNQANSFNLLTGASATDNSGETISIQTSGYDTLVGKHIVSYIACDSHSNCVTKKRIVTIGSSLYVDNSGANAPVLYTNMIPVKYDGTNWTYADIYNEWYNYDNKQWANAVVLNSGVNKSVGDTIDVVNDVSQMYVWIPRYKYTIFNGNNGSVAAQQINVVFESGTASTGTVTCTDAVAGSGSTSETCSTITNGTSTYTHPAFKFGATQLTGFWVGKFETSNVTVCTATTGSVGTACDVTTLGIQIKPNVTSWRGARVSTFYTAIASISTTYGINVDSHMMKNMEWGAVAYLEASKYGSSITDIGINNYSSYTTGCGAAAGSSSSSTCNTYNTTGVVASTTGNIYGVYDMSGGAWEYAMGDMVTSGNVPMVGSNSSNNSGFTGTLYNGTSFSGASLPDSKYYNKYTYDGSSSITHSRGKLGDATKETLTTYGNIGGGWYGDYAYFPCYLYPWFIRGGDYGSTSSAGVFYFTSGSGYADVRYGARVAFTGEN